MFCRSDDKVHPGIHCATLFVSIVFRTTQRKLCHVELFPPNYSYGRCASSSPARVGPQRLSAILTTHKLVVVSQEQRLGPYRSSQLGMKRRQRPTKTGSTI